MDQCSPERTSNLVLEELDVSCAIGPLDTIPLREGDDIRVRFGGGKGKAGSDEGQKDKAGGDHRWKGRVRS
jgi:hypothetical protein